MSSVPLCATCLAHLVLRKWRARVSRCSIYFYQMVFCKAGDYCCAAGVKSSLRLAFIPLAPSECRRFDLQEGGKLSLCDSPCRSVLHESFTQRLSASQARHATQK